MKTLASLILWPFLLGILMKTLNSMIGKQVIVRTYSAGVHFGTLSQKAKNEVILTDSIRLWQWKAKEGISLSSVAKFGVKASECKFAPKINEIWLEAIEIMPCTEDSATSIEGVDYVKTK
jgi:hypothetical protein